MRILIINSVIDFGSTGRICIEASEHLLKAGHEVKIAYGRLNAVFPANSKNGYRIGNRFSVSLHACLTRFFDLHGFCSTHSTKAFIKWADAYNPDVIWIHNLHGYYINIKVLFDWIKKRNLRVVWTLHDCWAFTGHCAHFSYISCDKWQTQCSHCPQLNQYPKSFASFTKNNFDKKRMIFTGVKDLKLVTPSLWLSELVSKSFLSDYKKIVINNGISIDSFYKEQSDYFSNIPSLMTKKRILCISNVWNQRKGLFDILKMCNNLKNNEIIVIVGKIPNKIKLPNNTYHIERTNDINELRNIYSSCDVMFNPTYEDTYPTINMEALSCETPVVCYKTGGAWEMLDESSVVEQGNIQLALELIRKIINKEHIYVFPDKNSFSKKIAIEKYEKLLIDGE